MAPTHVMKSIFFSLWTYRTVRIILGLLFLVAGVLKMTDLSGFGRIIAEFGLVPSSMVKIVALGLPLVEILAGGALLFDLRGGLEVISALLILFLSVLWFGIVNELGVDCGCFSQEVIDGHRALQNAFYRDLIMAAMVIYLYTWRWMNKCGNTQKYKCLTEVQT